MGGIFDVVFLGIIVVVWLGVVLLNIMVDEIFDFIVCVIVVDVIVDSVNLYVYVVFIGLGYWIIVV